MPRGWTKPGLVVFEVRLAEEVWLRIGTGARLAEGAGGKTG